VTAKNNQLCLRTTVQGWLKNHDQRPAWLAQAANINPSILSRFLNGTTALNEVTALRLYKVMKWRMRFVEREQFLEAAGLLDLLNDTAPTTVTEAPAVELLTSENAFNTGLTYLNAARAVTGYYDKAIGLYRIAEHFFGTASTNAAYAAIQIAHHMTISGDIMGAENEFARVASVYEGIMDPLTRMYYSETRGYMEFDRADLAASARWHRKCIEIAKTTGQWAAADDSLTHMVFIPLEIANATPGAHDIQEPLDEAERYLEVYKRYLHRDSNAELHMSGYYLTRAKLRRAQGRYQDAKSDLRQSYQIYPAIPPPGKCHIDMEAAEIALALGDTAEARQRAIPAREVWSGLMYAGGASRATRILATAALMEGNGVQAFELALAAACINPFGTYQDRSRLGGILAGAEAQARFDLLPRDYTRLTIELRHKAEERRGAFAPLAAIAPAPRASLDDIFNRLGHTGAV